MTIYKTFRSQRRFGTVPILQRVRREGIVYFVVVVVINCVSFGFAARESRLLPYFIPLQHSDLTLIRFNQQRRSLRYKPSP